LAAYVGLMPICPAILFAATVFEFRRLGYSVWTVRLQLYRLICCFGFAWCVFGICAQFGAMAGSLFAMILSA
ncbi:MAG: hypothetical protein AAGC70_13620, partial [Pseudomonadota bacterium]